MPALCGSWLACDENTSVHMKKRGDAIAGKPAPTQACSPTIIPQPYRAPFSPSRLYCDPRLCA
ncbi:hypothetical protein EJJ20_12355 [Pseudomonas poae]|nr:hypothetical protein EJJ20_12355 [Pseudomonas poae]